MKEILFWDARFPHPSPARPTLAEWIAPTAARLMLRLPLLPLTSRGDLRIEDIWGGAIG